MNWTIIVPLKALPAAKSRLLPVTSGEQAHAALVEAIRADTLAAAAAAARVLVVVDSADGTAGPWPVLVQSQPGLNQAVREAADHAAAHWPNDGIAALVGDLPAVTSADVLETLAAAVHHPRGYVADSAGTGTTMLTALPGVALDPAFGPDSAARHELIAHPLPAAAGLRLDVDTASDLEEAQKLGVGAATRAILTR